MPWRRVIETLLLIGGTLLIVRGWLIVHGTTVIAGGWLVWAGYTLRALRILRLEPAHQPSLNVPPSPPSADPPERTNALSQRPSSIRIADFMRSRIVTIHPDSTIRILARMYAKAIDQEIVPVVNQGRLVGIVSPQDAGRVPLRDWDRLTVRDIMGTKNAFITATPHEDADALLRRIANDGANDIAVIAHGRLLGLVDRRKLAEWLRKAPAANSGAADPTHHSRST